MKKNFETSSTNFVPVNSVSTESVEAVDFIMNNVFDWDSHKEHAGLRMGYENCKNLTQSLQANLESACPDVHGQKIIDGFDAYIGGRIQSLRLQKNLSQEDVASHIGVSPQQIQKYEIGADKVYATTLIELSQYIDAPITSFYEGYDASKTPHSSLSSVLQDYVELLHNNWAGQFSDIKHLTRSVIRVYLEAEAGNRAPLEFLGRQLKGKINFMETHYPDVSHAEGVPLHVLSEAMDSKEEGPRQAIESMSALKQQAQSVIGQGTASQTSLARSKMPGLFKVLGL